MQWWRGLIPLPEYTPPPRIPLAERFWAKVDRNGPWCSHLKSNCWLWTASILPNGYGQFDHSTAHRKSYMITHPNEDVTGLHIDHQCRRLDCVNPSHLEAVTPTINVQRGYAVNVMVSLRKQEAEMATHCRNGHQRTSDSVYITPEGWKVCRECSNANARKRRKELKCSP